MNKIIIILCVFIPLLICGCSEKSESSHSYESIHCILGDRAENDSIELFFDFKDKQVYRYSILTVSKYTENINMENYLKITTNNTNQKYAGAMGKVWHDDEKLISMETFDLELLSEEDFKQLTGMSKKELQKQTREEIIESIVPLGDNVNYSCN